MQSSTATDSARRQLLPLGRRLTVLGALAALACDNPDEYPPGEFILTEGQEIGTWTADPPVVRARVDRVLQDGTRERVSSLEVPPERFSMGSEGVGSFEVAGFDADDQRQVYGRSYLMNTPSLSGFRLPLFVGRTGRFCRPPGNLNLSHGAGTPVALYAERQLLVAGRSTEGMVLTEVYDLAYWDVYSAPELRCPVEDEVCQIRTLAVIDGSVIVALGEDWLRSYLIDIELIEGTSVARTVVSYEDATLPDGLQSFSDVAGGQAVVAPDGDVYIVGATRAVPTTAVLRVVSGAHDGAGVTLRALQLNTPRAGAAAAWIEDSGLVVAGGSSEGAGLELLRQAETEFVELPYSADATAGAGLASMDATSAVRVGGLNSDGEPAATVRIALDCDEECAPELWADPVALSGTTAFALDDGGLLAVGSADGGQTEVFRLRDAQPEPVALREPRAGATALRLPTGHVAVVGGVLEDESPARSFELFAR